MRVGEVSAKNSTTTPLGVGGTFLGGWEQVSYFASVSVACLASHSGTLYAEFSQDGVTTHSTLTYDVAANINEVHRLSVSRAYFRVRYVNNGAAQTSFHVQTIYGYASSLSSPFNTTIQQDSDTLVTRALDMELDIAAGRVAGYELNNKAGRNPDVDSGSTPEDIWESGGVYTGFPVSDLETLTVISTSVNDTADGSGARTLRITGLDADYNVINETVTLNGTTGVATTQQFRRAHTAAVLTSGSSNTAFNAGVITIRHTTTVANIFLTMLAGRNQTNSAGFTIPAGKTGIVKRFQIALLGGSTASVDGALWVRRHGAAPRLQRPFSVTGTYVFSEDIYGGLSLPEKTDIIPRILSTAGNNLDLVAKYDVLLIEDP